MALRLDDGTELPTPKIAGRRFGEQYPNFTDWLDGSTWELDTTDDLLCAPINNFRASLYYQAQAAGRHLVTKTVIRVGEDGLPRRKLLVRAE
jgi:hypothetical protein